MNLSIEKINELENIFLSKNWTIEKDLSRFSSVFNRFCKRLEMYDEEKQNLILELTEDFLNISINEIYDYFINSINEIENLDDYRTILLCPLKSLIEEKPKSADHLWYHLKSFCDFSYERFSRKIRFESDWEVIKRKLASPDCILVLIDDYIGSGRTVNEIIEELLIADHLEHNNEFFVISLIATEIGIENVRARYGNIVACNKIIKRGITDKYIGAPLEKNTRLMYEIEHVLKVQPDFSFGFAQSESLVAIHNKTPNNSFPVFWLEKGSKVAPFKTR